MIQLYPLPSDAELARAYAAQYATAGHYQADADRCRMSARTYYQRIVGVLKRYDAKFSTKGAFHVRRSTEVLWQRDRLRLRHYYCLKI